MKLIERPVIVDIVIGDGDGATFFEVFDLGPITRSGFFAGERTIWSVGETMVADSTRCDYGDYHEFARKFMLENFVFCPRVDAIKDNVTLTSFDEIASLSNGAFDDEIFAFAFADFFAEFLLTLRGDVDTFFAHGIINNTAEVDLWDIFLADIVDRFTFARTRKADKGENLYVFVISTHISSVTEKDFAPVEMAHDRYCRGMKEVLST